MLQVTENIALAEDELEEQFIRAPGPGGQNVNKVARSVQLRFNAAASPAPPPAGLPQRWRRPGRRRPVQGGPPGRGSLSPARQQELRGRPHRKWCRAFFNPGPCGDGARSRFGGADADRT